MYWRDVIKSGWKGASLATQHLGDVEFSIRAGSPGGDSDASEDGILDSWLQNIRRTLLECYVFFGGAKRNLLFRVCGSASPKPCLM